MNDDQTLVKTSWVEGTLLESPLGWENRFLSKNSETGRREERRSSLNF